MRWVTRLLGIWVLCGALAACSGTAVSVSDGGPDGWVAHDGGWPDVPQSPDFWSRPDGWWPPDVPWWPDGWWPNDGPWWPDAVKICGPIPGGQCASNEVCDIKSCALGATGICVPKPVSCSPVYSPVCGCNNVTYPNDCVRLQAGVALKHVGTCQTIVDAGPWPDALQLCLPGGCGPGQVCDVKGCGIGASGICVPKPVSCTYLWDPVCGCDNQTYPNDCVRLQAGVALQYYGACGTIVDAGPKPDFGPKICGPFPGGQCSWNEVCDVKSCALGASGICVSQPTVCPPVYSPVCGCDNKTYPNDCVRLQTGVALNYYGACQPTPFDGGPPVDAPIPSICGGYSGYKCPSGMVCNIYGCAPSTTGTCVPAPTGCPFLWDPVCGCDNQTYPNDCLRLLAGVALKNVGDCQPVVVDGGPIPPPDASSFCGGIAGIPCPWGMVCDIQTCAMDGAGTCVYQPTSCPAIWDPVCGCNNLTYINDCARLMAAVALNYKGICQSIPDKGVVIPD